MFFDGVSQSSGLFILADDQDNPGTMVFATKKLNGFPANPSEKDYQKEIKEGKGEDKNPADVNILQSKNDEPKKEGRKK